jgi:hypothetical protein
MLVAALDICASGRKTASANLCADARDTLRALAAERDKWHAGWMEAEAKVSELEEEHDALKAEVGRLREVLSSIRTGAKDNGYGSNYIICHNCADTYEATSAALQENTDD